MSAHCQNVISQPVKSPLTTHTTKSRSEESISDDRANSLPQSALVDAKGLLERHIDLPDLVWEDLPELRQAIEETFEAQDWILRFINWAGEQEEDIA